MKTIKFYFAAFILVAFFSCEIEPDDNVTGDYQTGGELLVSPTNQLVSYVLGDDATYSVSFFVTVSGNPTTSVDVYKKFVGADGSVSNESLLKTIAVDNYGEYSFDFKYEDLIEGLDIDGTPLPASDSGLAIADKWVLSYHSKLNNGNEYIANVGTNVAVGTRLAGIYDIDFSEYHHWNGSVYSFVVQGGGEWTRTVESVKLTDDYTIYKYSNVLFDYWADGHSYFYFYVYNDPLVEGGNDYKIEIPKEYEGEATFLFDSELELATCEDLATYDPPAPPFSYDCDDVFVTLKDDGHDVIHIIYGYITSGIRPGYEENIKK